MPHNKSIELLRSHNLRVTLPRQLIIEYFLNHDRAISYNEIENTFSKNIDRVTVYRTLKSFVENGLVHIIPDEKDTARYALCKDSCTSTNHRHNHVHFKCTLCGNTTCLEDVHIPDLTIPHTFTIDHITLIASGVCNSCNK